MPSDPARPKLCDWCDSPAAHESIERWRNEYGRLVSWTERYCDRHWAEHRVMVERMPVLAGGVK